MQFETSIFANMFVENLWILAYFSTIAKNSEGITYGLKEKQVLT
jgi:hypothetical protein